MAVSKPQLVRYQVERDGDHKICRSPLIPIMPISNTPNADYSITMFDSRVTPSSVKSHFFPSMPRGVQLGVVIIDCLSTIYRVGITEGRERACRQFSNLFCVSFKG